MQLPAGGCERAGGFALWGRKHKKHCVVGQQGWVQGKEQTRGSLHNIPPYPFPGTFNQTWICAQDLLPQHVSTLSDMTACFHPMCQHTLLSVEHTWRALGTFPTQWLVQARCYTSLIANKALLSKVIGYKICSEWWPLLSWASSKEPCFCNKRIIM